MRKLCVYLLLFFVIAPVWSAQLPKLNVLRFDEDWSQFETPEGKWNPYRLKNISLNSSGSAFLSLGGQARVRYENWNNFNFTPANDDDFVLTRFFLHGDLHLGKHARIFLEGKAANSSTRDLPGGKRTLDVDSTAFQNAFLDLMLPLQNSELGIRGGRQELKFGRQRLVSPLDWANTRRTFDGVRGWSQTNSKKCRLDLFYTRPVQIRRYESNSSNDNTSFWGFYGTTKLLENKAGVDYYLLNLHTNKSTTNMDRYTPGLRFWTPITSVLKFDVEAAIQTGEMGSMPKLDIDAWMLASELKTIPAPVWSDPLVFIRYDYASGDSNPNDSRNETFNHLFPLGHAYLGFIDTVGRQNINHTALAFANKPFTPKLKFLAKYHFFRRAEKNDALYNAGGGVVRAAGGVTSKDVGEEIDLLLKWTICRGLVAIGGYSYFYTGDFIKKATPAASSDIEFAYTGLQLTF